MKEEGYSEWTVSTSPPLGMSPTQSRCVVHLHSFPAPEPPHSTRPDSFQEIKCSEMKRVKNVGSSCCLSPFSAEEVGCSLLSSLPLKLEGRYKFRQGSIFTETFLLQTGLVGNTGYLISILLLLARV